MSQTWEYYEEYGVDDATANRILDRIEGHSQDAIFHSKNGYEVFVDGRLEGIKDSYNEAQERLASVSRLTTQSSS